MWGEEMEQDCDVRWGEEIGQAVMQGEEDEAGCDAGLWYRLRRMRQDVMQGEEMGQAVMQAEEDGAGCDAG